MRFQCEIPNPRQPLGGMDSWNDGLTAKTTPLVVSNELTNAVDAASVPVTALGVLGMPGLRRGLA